MRLNTPVHPDRPTDGRTDGGATGRSTPFVGSFLYLQPENVRTHERTNMRQQSYLDTSLSAGPLFSVTFATKAPFSLDVWRFTKREPMTSR